jgi:hypothetical protein
LINRRAGTAASPLKLAFNQVLDTPMMHQKLQARSNISEFSFMYCNFIHVLNVIKCKQVWRELAPLHRIVAMDYNAAACGSGGGDKVWCYSNPKPVSNAI